MDEFALIDRFFAPLARDASGALGLRDDGALVDVPAGHRLVVVKDMLVAGVHFLADDPPALVARKLLRVNLSDLAAMGAAPRAYLLGIAAPRHTGEDWFAALAEGLAADQAEFAVSLIGGDTTALDGPLVLSLTALGEVREGRELRRDRAQAGDIVYVSGTLGDGAIGLAILGGGSSGIGDAARAELAGRYRLPRPRIGLGLRLHGLAHGVVDVSDGLAADLGHMCRASGVGAEIEAGALPLSPAARAAIAADPSLAQLPLCGGDDYEIAFTAPVGSEQGVAALARDLELALTPIGKITAGAGVVARDGKGAAIDLRKAGYRHF